MIAEPNLRQGELGLLDGIDRVVPSGVQLRGPLASLALHGVLGCAWILFLPWMALLSPPVPEVVVSSSLKSHGTIYYFGPGLPEMSDRSGAPTGKSGRSSGSEHFHPMQTVHVAQGQLVVPSVVSVPTLRLPAVRVPANILMFPKSPTAAAPSPPIVWKPAMGRLYIQPELTRPVGGEVAPSTAILGLNHQLPSMMTRDYAVAAPSATVQSKAATKVDDSPSAPGPADVNNKDVGIILSAKSGHEVGAGETAIGALAMSPAGTINGAVGTGNDAGRSGAINNMAARVDVGTGSTGNGLGAEASARSGISPAHGPGGAGNSSAPRLAPGVLISNGQYFIPSFASGPGPLPSPKSRTWIVPGAPAVVVVATPNSGNVLISSLRAARVYTLYLDTNLGAVVFQFAENAPPGTAFERDLTAPAPVTANFPEGFRISRTTINCLLDKAGKLRELAFDRTSSPDLIPKLFEILQSWLFRPALKGGQPVEVHVAIGINTGQH